MAVGSKDRKDREARAARERTRLYQARRQFHERQAKRRTRDNLIAGIAGVFLLAWLFGRSERKRLAGTASAGPDTTPAHGCCSPGGPRPGARA